MYIWYKIFYKTNRYICIIQSQYKNICLYIVLTCVYVCIEKYKTLYLQITDKTERLDASKVFDRLVVEENKSMEIVPN